MQPAELIENILIAANQMYPTHQEWILEDATLGQFLEVLEDMHNEREVIE